MANPVPNPVQRLRYFDGEYLRSYDFTDEQSYHIEMRRLMNLKLHLHGIVYGLEIVQDADSVPASNAYFFSIAPGMAIDPSGREIVVAAPYSLTNVLNGPGLSVGSPYEVWICYQESETGLPAAGYQDCSVVDQSTRWQESFHIQLMPTSGASVVPSCGGVRLGYINLITSPSGYGRAVQQPASPTTYNIKRQYVGIRAQRVIAPDQLDASPDPYSITAMPPANIPDQLLPGYLDVHPGVFNRGNVIVKKNLVIGDDFELDNTTYKALPSDFTKIPTGNVKITQDLFLAGDFYGFVGGQWYGLKQYIQSLMPNAVIGSAPATIPVSPQSAAISSGTTTVSVSTILPSVGQTQVLLAISEIDWQDPNTLSNWSGNTTPITVGVSSLGLTSTGSGSYDLTIQWNVGAPLEIPAASGTWLLPVKTLFVNYMVIFQPS